MAPKMDMAMSKAKADVAMSKSMSKARAVAMKRPAEFPADGEPPEKEFRMEEFKLEDEEDAVDDEMRPKLDVPIGIEPYDVTLNLVPTLGGRLLVPMTDCGMNYLISAARANVGVTGGRYLFEARIMEQLELDADKKKLLMAKQQVRIGFSVPGSSLYLGDTADSVCFDSDGFILTDNKKKSVSSPFTRDQVMGVVLNLDQKSTNVNTVSLFRDGKRISKPIPLPKDLHGKALCPHVSFRGVTLQLNFGPRPMAKLPFKCNMIESAAVDEVWMTPPPPMVDGRCEVVVPVCIPDEGTQDWIEAFLEKHPHFVELSNRKLVEWIGKSGIPKAGYASLNDSNDRPDAKFGVPSLDELNPRTILNAVAPLFPRNYVVMDIQANLSKKERMLWATKFGSQNFRTVARVAVGEPSLEFKSRVHANLLKQKSTLSKMDRQRLEAQQRQIAVEEAQKKAKEAAMQRAQAKAKAEVEKRVSEAEVKTNTEGGEEEEAKAKDDATMAEEGQEKTEQSTASAPVAESEEKQAEGAEGKEKDEQKADEPDVETESPVTLLSDEDRQQWFKSSTIPDLTSTALNTSLAILSLPEGSEGFDEVIYEWQPEHRAKDYLRQWVSKRKLTTRVEDITPSEWFFGKRTEWEKVLQQWQQRQKEYKADPERRAQLEAKAAAFRRKARMEKGQEADEEGQGGLEREFEEMDTFLYENILDIDGEGEPLFANFMFEDWSLMGLRFELYLLIKSFRQDVPDPERLGIHESHLLWYYNKYFKKTLNPSFFGTNSVPQLLGLIKDTVAIDEVFKILVLSMTEPADFDDTPFDMFIKLTEQARRVRQRRIDTGDDSARLKFSITSVTTPTPATMKSMTKAAPKTLAVPTPKVSAWSFNQSSDFDGFGGEDFDFGWGKAATKAGKGGKGGGKKGKGAKGSSYGGWGGSGGGGWNTGSWW